MLPRGLLGYVLALPAIVIVLSAINTSQVSTITVKMSATASGVLQIFYDSGKGFSEAQSTVTAVQVSDQPHEYRLFLPPGEYRSFRIDPGNVPGRYVIQKVTILNAGNSTVVDVDLADLKPVYQISTIERTSERLVVDALGIDPELLYTPQAPLKITSNRPAVAALVTRCAAWWLGMVVLLWLVERVLTPLAPAAAQAVRSAARTLAA